jgi:hypothetical protein
MDQRQGHNNRSSGEKFPTIPQPFTIRRDVTDSDKEQYKEERTSRNAQIRVAMWQNGISVVAAVISILSLGAVFLSIRESRKTFEAGERAWVLVDEMSLAHDFSNTESTPVKFVIKNVGQSPALNLTSEIHADFSGDGCPSVKFHSPYTSDSVVGPGQTQTYGNFVVSTLSQQCVDALHSGSAAYTIKGTMQYKDIFGHVHSTGICSQYEGVSTRKMSDCADHIFAD